MSELIASDTTNLDYGELVAGLNQYLRLRTTPIGMKLFESAADMEAIPRIRRPKAIHTTDQIVAQAARLGWTVGITGGDLVGEQCRAVVGLGKADAEWKSGKHMSGVWFATDADAALAASDAVLTAASDLDEIPGQTWIEDTCNIDLED